MTKLNGGKITESTVDPMLVKPVDIIVQFQLQMLKAVEVQLMDEFRFHDFICGFGHRIIIGTAFHAERTSDFKGLENLVHFVILKLTATVGMKPLYLA